jgi:hypothetical protein
MSKKMLLGVLTATAVVVAITVVATRKSATPPTAGSVARPASQGKPLLIQHGWDVTNTATTAKNAALTDALPFDGMSILPKLNPCATVPISQAEADADMAAMPKLTKVIHNFVLCRLTEDAPVGGGTAYDMNNDATWSAVAANLATYARAAKATGMFDGLMIDTEYYGKGPNPWDHDTIPIPLTYGRARPWSLPVDARAKAQSRGKQITDAVKAAWPNAVLLSLRGAELADSATYKSANMGGNDVAWANELASPFFVGMVESAVGTELTVVDGGESYRQRTLADFHHAYTWLKTGLADSGGPILPSGAVTAASYKATVSVASNVFDKDMSAKLAIFPATALKELLANARQATDRYYWFYTEAFDWKASGYPDTPAPKEYIDAIAASR